TDADSNKQAVLISIAEWQEIQRELAEWRTYLALKTSLKKAFQEVEDIKQGKAPRVTLKAFLNES
ncbi:MAG: hypothetical protein LRY28_01045, partial [Erysipelotrichaceae bacterium]|nr:hypothetical protein [Erysipelotrichaceae bacterium]